MTHRESFTLAAVTFLLGAILGLWAYWKFLCPSEQPVQISTEIIKYREIEKRITDTITRVEVRREQLAGEVVTVIEFVDRFDSAAVDSCLAGIPGKTLCLEHSLFPILQAQVKNGDTLAGLLQRKINFKDSISEVYRKDGEQCRRDKKKGLNAAKLKGGGIVLGAAAIWQGVKKLFGF